MHAPSGKNLKNINFKKFERTKHSPCRYIIVLTLARQIILQRACMHDKGLSLIVHGLASKRFEIFNGALRPTTTRRWKQPIILRAQKDTLI